MVIKFNMNDQISILMFTIDFVFVEILKRIFENEHLNFSLDVLNSFSDANEVYCCESVKLIVVDDNIIGTSSYELISYLRLEKHVSSPIIYFGSSEHDGERKALMTGANFFVNKPFNTYKVTEIIKSIFIDNQLRIKTPTYT